MLGKVILIMTTVLIYSLCVLRRGKVFMGVLLQVESLSTFFVLSPRTQAPFWRLFLNANLSFSCHAKSSFLY